MTIMTLNTYKAGVKMLRDLVGRWAGSLEDGVLLSKERGAGGGAGKVEREGRQMGIVVSTTLKA